MCLFLTGPACEDSWVGSAQGQARVFCMCLSREQHCCLAEGFEMEGRTTQQDLGLSFLTMCAVATILDKPA